MLNAVCFKVKPVGKPDAVAPHVRFDERGWETGLYATAPVLDSTVLFNTAMFSDTGKISQILRIICFCDFTHQFYPSQPNSVISFVKIIS